MLKYSSFPEMCFANSYLGKHCSRRTQWRAARPACPTLIDLLSVNKFLTLCSFFISGTKQPPLLKQLFLGNDHLNQEDCMAICEYSCTAITPCLETQSRHNCGLPKVSLQPWFPKTKNKVKN